jgi:nucleotide-binding universal stress UspA family protein
MYRSIYLPLDNSPLSLAGADLAIDLAGRGGALLAGSHVYAAKLHDRRFRQMEGGLPAPYRREEKLVEQREIHDDLITRGLKVISDSYLDVFAERCARAAVQYRRVALEGRNWQRLVEDIGASDADLVVMGALGLGAVATSQLGSVCERVARRIDRDLLVVRQADVRAPGAIAVALDGSPQSYGGLLTALELGALLGRPVEAVAAFDPYFHYAAFNSIAGALSPEAAQLFRFKEQEKLHEEVIDSGLAKIYQGHLDIGAALARERGAEIATRLLAGKAFEQLLRYAQEARPWLLVLGRIGVHSDAAMDLGSATENLLRLAPCNLLLSARCFSPPVEKIADATMAWTEEAERRMARVPEFARGMARSAVLAHAARQGHTVVTSDVIDGALGRMPGGKCPFAASSNAADEPAGREAPRMAWEPEALSRLQSLPEAVRQHARLRIEKLARRMGRPAVTAEVMDAASRAVSQMLG